ERVHRGLVRDDDRRVRLEVRYAIWPAQHRDADECLDERERGEVRAGVRDGVVADADDDAVLVIADLDLVVLLAAVRRRDEVLPAVLDPLDRQAELPRAETDQDLLGIDL